MQPIINYAVIQTLLYKSTHMYTENQMLSLWQLLVLPPKVSTSTCCGVELPVNTDTWADASIMREQRHLVKFKKIFFVANSRETWSYVCVCVYTHVWSCVRVFYHALYENVC